jgi:hypothetical protein
MKTLSKMINTLLLIYLLFTSSVTTMKIKKWLPTDPTQPVDSGKMAGTCIKAMMENIPPDFCWKKGADFGKIPTDCPTGYFRSLALCYQNCDDGYKFVLGVCWAHCESGYDDHGATCYKSFFHWYFKHSYIPSSLTNFSSQVPCPRGMYRQGALCYRNCENIAMENCGFAACSASKESCMSSIVNISLDVMSGIADAVMFVMSFGATTAIATAKNTVKNAIKKLGKSTLKGILKGVAGYFKSKFKTAFFGKAVKSVGILLKDTSKDLVKGKLTDAAITNVCKHIWESIITQSVSTPEVNLDTISDSLDVFNAKGITAACHDPSEENAAIDCAANVIGGLSAFDSTGLLTIAAAFMHPTCEVPADYEEFVDNSEAEAEILAEEERIKNNEENCIFLYLTCDYVGQSLKVCDSLPAITDRVWNDQARSMKVGSKAKGLLFEHYDYQGNGFLFGPGMQIPCFKDIKMEGNAHLDDNISSILFGGQDCLVFRYQLNDSRSTFHKRYCPTESGEIDDTIPWNDIIFFEYKSYNPYLTTIFYSGSSFTGQTWEVSGNRYYESPNSTNRPPVTSLKSFRTVIHSQDGVGYVRYVEIQSADGNDSYLQFSQIVVLDEYGNNISKKRPARASSTHNVSKPASIAVDGNETVRNFPDIFHSANTRGDRFTIDLLRNFYVKTIKIYGRGDCCENRLVGAKINLLDASKNVIKSHVIKEAGKEFEISFVGEKKTKVEVNSESKINNNIRYVKLIAPSGGDNPINISQIVVRDEKGTNIAMGKPVTASSSLGISTPQKIVDGNESARRYPDIFHSANNSGDHVTIDLNGNYNVNSVEIYNRGDCCSARIVGAKLLLMNAENNIIREVNISEDQPKITLDFNNKQNVNNSVASKIKKVRYVVLAAKPTNGRIILSQIVVRDENGTNIAKGKPISTSVQTFMGSLNLVVDGNESNRSFPDIFHTYGQEGTSVTIDLENKSWVKSVELYSRGDCCEDANVGAKVKLLDSERGLITELPIKEYAAKKVLDFS